MRKAWEKKRQKGKQKVDRLQTVSSNVSHTCAHQHPRLCGRLYLLLKVFQQSATCSQQKGYLISTMTVCNYVRFFLLQPLSYQMCPVIKKKKYLIAIYTKRVQKIKKTASPMQTITEENTVRLKGEGEKTTHHDFSG